VLPLDDQQQQLGAQQAGDQHVDRHVADLGAVEARLARLAGGDPETGQERAGEQHAVGVQGDGA
jgi:hypothetical protein